VNERAFTGCILTGGASRRMGRDKAFLEVGGRSLAARAGEALLGAGAERVFCVGGDAPALRAAGFEVHPDSRPGSGPLAAVLDAFELAQTDVLMVLACDLPQASADAVRITVAGLEKPYQVAMPLHADLPQYLHAAYDRSAVVTLQAAFGAGERSLRGALASARIATVQVPDPASLADADRPEDLE
jgi:molybdopterin-guanine dinucleotide biosynthesis protein A